MLSRRQPKEIGGVRPCAGRTGWSLGNDHREPALPPRRERDVGDSFAECGSYGYRSRSLSHVGPPGLGIRVAAELQ